MTLYDVLKRLQNYKHLISKLANEEYVCTCKPHEFVKCQGCDTHALFVELDDILRRA